MFSWRKKPERKNEERKKNFFRSDVNKIFHSDVNNLVWTYKCFTNRFYKKIYLPLELDYLNSINATCVLLKW